NTTQQIEDKRNFIADAKELMKRYKKQQDNVRNNREYNAITKEIEYQELEIQLAEKHIKEFYAQIEHKKEVLEQTEAKIAKRQEHLDHKKEELDTILAETEKEEQDLLKKSEKYKGNLED